MADRYKSKNDNGKHGKSYRQTLLENNLWRCDCSNEGNSTNIDNHEEGCRFAFWYVENDLHLDDKGDKT